MFDLAGCKVVKRELKDDNDDNGTYYQLWREMKLNSLRHRLRAGAFINAYWFLAHRRYVLRKMVVLYAKWSGLTVK